MNKAIADTIRELRKLNRISQEKLANAINSHQVYISEIESEKKIPSIIVLFNISKAFNMKLSDFIKIVESKLPQK